ncbi:MAG: xanthine dehydrogenase family protein molybdopterin-binding subunit, partial [Gemmatimonadetes bacterium]|nr:xanthine dehydrogenase family protein molybdopterin-binding subunit [Gemmatimonadota bacterium]
MAELIGKDFTPPDIRAKVTGAAKYAEDFRMDGMLFCRLLKSPMPHALVRSIDARTALAMDGVVAILTADEVPPQPGPANNILTNEPHFVGEPILAVAAVDEQTAEDAIEAIELDLQARGFCVDPLESLRPGGPDARSDGNTYARQEGVYAHKWTADDFGSAAEGQMPQGEPTMEWSYGDLDTAFADAALVLDESFVTASHAHHSMEPRSCLA